MASKFTQGGIRS
jgi:hypothetical protein